MDATLRDLAQKQASFCSVFGNARRILIVWILGDTELPVHEIAAAMDASMQNTSQHLRVMKDRGIVEARRDGQTIYYRIAQNELFQNCPLIHLAQSPPLTPLIQKEQNDGNC